MINKLNKWDLNCSVFNSYDFDDCMSLNELLCRFFTKINECIEASNKTLTLLEWLKEVGLKQEVVTLLTQWKDDGTLANLISEQILQEINQNIENNKNAIEHLQLKDTTHDEKIEALETKDNEILEEIETLKSKDTEFEGTISTINGKISIIEEGSKQLSTNLNSLSLKVTKNENDINQLNSVVMDKFNEYNENIVFVNEFSEQLRNNDWASVFNYIFENIVNDTTATVMFNGRLNVKTPIIIPEGVNLKGVGLPYSGLNVDPSFSGEYVIIDSNNESHNSIENIYFDFSRNQSVKGIKCENPYDYIKYSFLVANAIGTTFLTLGGDKISQSIELNNIYVYREPVNETEPIVLLYNIQELYSNNNKWLFKSPFLADCVYCDGVTNSLFLHDSYGFSNKSGIKFLSNRYKKPINGNNVKDCLFESVNPQEEGSEGCVVIIGDNTNKGGYNNIVDNMYYSSTPIIRLQNTLNNYISDPVRVKELGGAGRNYFFNKYNLQSTNPTGNVEEWCDGAYKHLKGWFKIDPVQDGGGSWLYMKDTNGVEYTITISTSGELQVNRS